MGFMTGTEGVVEVDADGARAIHVSWGEGESLTIPMELVRRLAADSAGPDVPSFSGAGPETSTSVPSLRGMDHVGLTVPDIAEAAEFFTGLLGFREFYSHGPYVDEEGDSQRIYFDRHPRSECVEIRMLRTHNLNLELLQFNSPDQVRTVPKTSDWGSAHLALYVDDMAHAVDYLRANGVRVLGGPLPLPGPEAGDDAEFCFFLTPWGQPMELISYPHGKGYERTTSDRLYSPTSPETVWTVER